MKNKSMIFASSALLAFAGAVAAQAAPQQAQPEATPQKGASQQMQRPTPKPASAKQVAACDKVANKLMTSLKDKDFSGATDEFSKKLKPKLPASQLESGWKSLVKQNGEPESIGHASNGQQIQDYTVVLVPMQFKKAQMGAQVACSSKGKVASLRIGAMPGKSKGETASSKS